MVIFARAPELGRVKTRLAADVGVEEALAIYRWLGARALSAARAVPACELEVRFTPDEGRDAVARWLGVNIVLRPQCADDLGVRMHTAIAEALADGVEAVAVVGTDCPALDTAIIERAFESLESADVVLGPALDGGYYLIAMRAPHRVVCEHIPWSSPNTLARTVAAAKGAGLRVSLLDERADIDTGEDWQQWLRRPECPSPMPALRSASPASCAFRR